MTSNSNVVGFGKPPKHSQFKPGQSGNPKGRPRKGESLISLINRELDTPIAINEDGVKTDIMKRTAVAKVVVRSMMIGNLSAIKLYVELQEIHEIKQSYHDSEEDADEPIEITLNMATA
jgi:hypothetical protein